MTNRDWLITFDQSYKNFEWFFREYKFNSEWEALLSARDKENIGKMKTLMNRVWFELPSNKFNIKTNPKGWNDFIFLLDFE